MKKMSKKCSTDQIFMQKRNTTYKIETLIQKLHFNYRLYFNSIHKATDSIIVKILFKADFNKVATLIITKMNKCPVKTHGHKNKVASTHCVGLSVA